MKRSIPYWQTAGFIFTGLCGTFLHFFFDLTNGSVSAAVFSAVNESIWEHMKLLFYPMLAFSIIEYGFWGKYDSRFFCIKRNGTLLGLFLIPVIYYTYTGVLGISVDWFNIAIFFIAAGISFYVETILFSQTLPTRGCPFFCLMQLVLVAVIFTVCTFAPIQIPLFQDPVTGTYGLIP